MLGTGYKYLLRALISSLGNLSLLWLVGVITWVLGFATLTWKALYQYKLPIESKKPKTITRSIWKVIKFHSHLDSLISVLSVKRIYRYETGLWGSNIEKELGNGGHQNALVSHLKMFLNKNFQNHPQFIFVAFPTTSGKDWLIKRQWNAVSGRSQQNS